MVESTPTSTSMPSPSLDSSSLGTLLASLEADPDQLTQEQWDELHSQTLPILARQNSLQGLIAFGELVFGYRPEPHHVTMLEALLDAVYTKTDTLILMPTGSAKTTWGNTIFLSWLSALFKDIRIGLFSETAPFADAFSRAIMTVYEENEKFRDLFGNLVGPRWTAGEWLRKGSRWSQSKDLTVFAGGMGGQVASKRFDLLLCDDILGKANTATIDQIEKTKSWFDNPLSRRVVAQGVTIVFGTRWAEGDLYETLMTPIDEGGYGFKTVIIRGLIEDPGPDESWVDENKRPQRRLNGFRSYWEDQWPVDKFLIQRARNPAQFDCSIQNDITGLISGDIFQRIWYRGRYYGTRAGNPWDELPPGRYTIRMGQDLASSEKERADFTARVTTAENLDTGDMYVMRTFRSKISTGHSDFIAEGYAEGRIDLVLCEDNAFQSTVVKNVMKEYPRIPIVGRKTDSDKTTRAKALAEKYRMGKVHHHLSLEDGELEREQLAFKGTGRSHDDLIDAEGFSMDLAGNDGFFFGKLRVR